MTTILNEIIINGRKEIVEFGSGISTIYIAKLLKEHGGRLNSFEHDENWVHIITKLLKENNLNKSVSVNFAPLSKSKFCLDNCKWYDENIVRSKIITPVDLIIVDGPPAYLNDLALSRYPAIPCIHSKLSDDYCIILDDIDRSGEEQIIGMWETELGIQFFKSYVKGGIAIGRSKSAFNI
ncbi:class I SAM-dependent methyltransferase [Methanolobus mangrovi]|uniref:Class I SAM-dependent methyltransferase n=1 Tax=Methanolobus mangrovi TaxID=3072977 RepID=A0AA51UHE2_9EURY|nr:class I SAM-dependent methyltransferase [Methanolobus mangrovi]WMW23235.1 class I SAM-dependent methyltransferase [Methanolobus mangrovi]